MNSNATAVQAITPPCERSPSSGSESPFDAGKTGSLTTSPVISKAFASEVPHWLPAEPLFQKENS
jgi:hypothetical protein